MVVVYIRVGVGSLGRDLCRQVRSGSRGFTCERLWDVGFVRVREVSRGGAYAGPFGFVLAHYGAPKGRSVHSSLHAFTRAQHVVVGFAPMSRRTPDVPPCVNLCEISDPARTKQPPGSSELYDRV